jgi:hypothetical protein
MFGEQNLIDSVPPFIAPTSWIVMASPDSSDALKAFQWKGKKLAMKFGGGWSIASCKRPCSRKELSSRSLREESERESARERWREGGRRRERERDRKRIKEEVLDEVLILYTHREYILHVHV